MPTPILRIEIVILMVVAVIGGAIGEWVSPVPAQAQTRPVCFTLPDFSKYTAVTPTKLLTTQRTHVKVTGVVTVVTREEDGDLHVGVTDGTTKIVAECIPEMPCPAVSRGDKVVIWGISRLDKQHGWYEVHPVEMMQVGK